MMRSSYASLHFCLGVRSYCYRQNNTKQKVTVIVINNIFLRGVILPITITSHPYFCLDLAVNHRCVERVLGQFVAGLFVAWTYRRKNIRRETISRMAICRRTVRRNSVSQLHHARNYWFIPKL